MTAGLPANPNTVATQQALTAIAEFEKSPLKGVWPHLDKATIVAEMRSRLSNPFNVNQGQQPFCGPASVLFELVRKQPGRYVQICRSLFETGRFEAQTKAIAASNELRQASKGNLQMGPADWMILATLRESENLLFPVEPDASEIIRGLAGMTKSWELKGWVREILGYRTIHYKHTYLLGDMAALRDAADIVAKGGVAFPLITAEGLLRATSPSKADLPTALPNHWVTLLGNVSIPTRGGSSDQVTFDVYTWARGMRVTVDERYFRRYFWGVVTGI